LAATEAKRGCANQYTEDDSFQVEVLSGYKNMGIGKIRSIIDVQVYAN
jgi:hypothetical protein